MENNVNSPKKESVALYLLRIGGILLLICALVALVLSFVNTVTKDRIEQNEIGLKREAIVELFGSETVEYTGLDLIGTDGEEIESIYRVTEDGETLGYCVSVLSPGFGGDVHLMVAATVDKTVIGVKIVSMSETPGLGTRVDDREYLAQYAGKSGTLSASGDIDVISGATKSSKAVLNGVNSALAALDGHLGAGVGGAVN